MLERTGVKWSREETILAFDLYCRTPFSKITKANKDIIALAELLGRTPSSVGMKMANLAHYDPEIKKKNLSGMSHGSKLDAEICEEFSHNWEELTLQAQKILAEKQETSVEKLLGIEMEFFELPEGQYREMWMKQRVGQYFFRASVLSAYGNHCCVTGLGKPDLLIASHIKPWAVSDEKTERTNPCNGICLNSLHDKAFDKGLITITSDFRIVISQSIKDTKMDQLTRDWFMSYENKQILLPDKFIPGSDFIEYHNDMIFQR